jgi:uncharacterized OB-fold protein
MSETLPAVHYIKLPENGEPFLEGQKCKSCSAVFTDKRSVCAKCGGRDTLETVKLSSKGKLYSYSIVHRSFPGIETPFVSAVVDLEGGGTLKGNLINVEPSPENVKFDMPVEVVFKDALGRKDKEGNDYICFFFQPAA